MMNDHGLFEKESSRDRVTTNDGEVFEPKTERDVFDMLGIRWKEPHERDGFDAVEGVDGDDLEPMSRADFNADHQHAWVD